MSNRAVTDARRWAVDTLRRRHRAEYETLVEDFLADEELAVERERLRRLNRRLAAAGAEPLLDPDDTDQLTVRDLRGLNGAAEKRLATLAEAGEW